jgi:hypothetical protein
MNHAYSRLHIATAGMSGPQRSTSILALGHQRGNQALFVEPDPANEIWQKN